MLDHMSINVSDIARARAFYDKALAPLGVTVQMTVPTEITQGPPVHGYGENGKPYFWLGQSDRPSSIHVAFLAATRADVEAFYAAAIAAGGSDNGGPGVRPHYHPNYYGAFVRDADGNNIEAVCHSPS